MTISFETWFTQILRYCRFITNSDSLIKSWINNDYSETSVTDFDELYEQIFDDLDADNLILYFNESEPNYQKIISLIYVLLTSIHSLNDRIESGMISNDAGSIIKSEEWSIVVIASENILLEAN